MKKKILLLLSISILSLNFAMAQTTCEDLACLANGLIPQVGSVLGFLNVLCYIFGITLGIKGVLKLRDVNESKGQVRIGVPIAILVAAACFISLPTAINMGIDTLSLGSFGAKKYGNY